MPHLTYLLSAYLLFIFFISVREGRNGLEPQEVPRKTSARERRQNDIQTQKMVQSVLFREQS